MTPSESAVQQTIIFWWDKACSSWALEPADLFHIPNGRARSKPEGRLLKLEGVRRGIPDLFLSVPGGDGEYGLWLEVKRPGGRVAPIQRYQHERLRERGYRVEVVDCLDKATAAVSGYLGERKLW